MVTRFQNFFVNFKFPRIFQSLKMSDESWAPPQTIDELYKAFQPGHVFAGINRPTAGARDDKSVDVGAAPFQLYSLATPNGQKVGECSFPKASWTSIPTVKSLQLLIL
mmetsp:Transcript_29524/g.36481  ORF Transcript_29524/g.36481 Transcript_29524/m.36481 type:complete len:108 (-) Transcript_29524:1880-2203(-)